MEYQLTPDNYYSDETNWRYMSVSQYKSFARCEAETLAELKGDWKPTGNNKALLIGNYLHSYFESPESHEQFIKDNSKDICKKDGKLLSDYVKADKMIKTLDEDPAFNKLYEGDKEVIVQGRIGGVEWIGKIDNLNLDKGYFIDLKTTKDIRELVWNPEKHKKVSFIEAYNYYVQLAVYRELIEQTFGVKCRPMIIAVSKSDIPDKQAFMFESFEERTKLTDYFYEMLDRLPIYQAVKNGERAPMRCEHCDYCRSTKKLTIMHPTDLELGYM